MISRLTGGLRPWSLSLDGRLHDTQPPSSVGISAAGLGQDGQPLVEPGTFFVDGSYGIRINSWNALAGVVVTVRARFLNADGRIINHEWMHTPNTNRTKATSDFPLGVGFPLNITCFASSGTPLIGQTFVQVQIISGLGGATTPLGTLLQDYVTAVQALAFPGSPIRSSTEGQGYPRTLTGSVPGVGAEISESVPSGARWQLISLFAQFAASVAVATRWPNLVLAAGAAKMAKMPYPAGVTASNLIDVTWGQGLVCIAAVAGTVEGFQGLPIGLVLPSGTLIKTETLNIQGTDQYNAPNMTLVEQLEAQ